MDASFVFTTPLTAVVPAHPASGRRDPQGEQPQGPAYRWRAVLGSGGLAGYRSLRLLR